MQVTCSRECWKLRKRETNRRAKLNAPKPVRPPKPAEPVEPVERVTIPRPRLPVIVTPMKYERREWQDHAACIGVPDHVWFPAPAGSASKGARWAEARRTCAGCPVLTDCREYAVKWLRYGYAGGMTPYERATYRREHGMDDDVELAG